MTSLQLTTVAETVEVRFVIAIDSDLGLRQMHPYLDLIPPKMGSAIQDVKNISGNDPQ